MAQARRVYVNPADPTQKHILYSTGYIQAVGGAVPIPQVRWGDAIAQDKSPLYYGEPSGEGPVVALCILDWDTPSGYTLDSYGLVWPWGGATASPGATAPFTTGPDYLFGGNGGFSTPYGYVIDFLMDPGGGGTGYLLLYNGDVVAIGTGATAVAHSGFLTDTLARQLQMDWASKRYWVLDGLGRVSGRNGGNNATVTFNHTPAGTDVAVSGAQYIWGMGGRGGFRLYDKSATPLGWTISERGAVSKINTAEKPYGDPRGTWALWVDMDIVDDGTGADPLRLVALTSVGTLKEWVISTAPSVTALAPDDPTTDTTRPLVGWQYLDSEGDAQDSYQVKVFTDAVYLAGGFDPDVDTPVWEDSGTDRQTRNVRVGVDLPNDTYRVYVNVTDTSGLASGWEYAEWTQNVTPPATPTITATAGATAIALAVNVNPAGLDPDALLLVQYSDDGGTTWEYVRDGIALVPDGSGDASVSDYDAPLNATRSYRALTYIYDSSAGTWLASDWSATDSDAIAEPEKWYLHDEYDAAATVRQVRVLPDLKLPWKGVAGVFYPAGRTNPIVVQDGTPKSPAFVLPVWALDETTRLALEELYLNRATTLVLRDPYARTFYLRVVGDISFDPIRAAGGASDPTTVRDASIIRASVQAVARPDASPTEGPLAP